MKFAVVWPKYEWNKNKNKSKRRMFAICLHNNYCVMCCCCCYSLIIFHIYVSGYQVCASKEHFCTRFYCFDDDLLVFRTFLSLDPIFVVPLSLPYSFSLLVFIAFQTKPFWYCSYECLPHGLSSFITMN